MKWFAIGEMLRNTVLDNADFGVEVMTCLLPAAYSYLLQNFQLFTLSV
jgi:hypothetical protein